MQAEVEAFQGFKVLIDHHQEPDGGYDHVYSQTSKSSTAEMVYDFIASDGGTLDVAAADCLLMGLITDTGSFRFLRERGYAQSGFCFGRCWCRTPPHSRTLV